MLLHVYTPLHSNPPTTPSPTVNQPNNATPGNGILVAAKLSELLQSFPTVAPDKMSTLLALMEWAADADLVPPAPPAATAAVIQLTKVGHLARKMWDGILDFGTQSSDLCTISQMKLLKSIISKKTLDLSFLFTLPSSTLFCIAGDAHHAPSHHPLSSRAIFFVFFVSFLLFRPYLLLIIYLYTG